MLRAVLLTLLPVALLAGAYLAVRPRVGLPTRRGRRQRREARAARAARRGSVSRRLAPFVLLAVLFGVSFAVTDDTAGTVVSFGVAAVLVVALVTDRWWRRRRAA